MFAIITNTFPVKLLLYNRLSSRIDSIVGYFRSEKKNLPGLFAPKTFTYHGLSNSPHCINRTNYHSMEDQRRGYI